MTIRARAEENQVHDSSSTLVDLLGRRATERGSDVVYRFLHTGDVDGPTEEWSYAEVDRRARAIAMRLSQAGLEGERVLLLFAPGLEFIAAFFGALYAGAIAVPAYPPDPARLDRTLPRLRHIAVDSGARCVVTTSQLAALAAAIRPMVAELDGIPWIAVDAPTEEMAQRWRPPAAVGADSVAFLQYTSGSTAAPRGVMVTHGNIIHNQGLIERAFALDEHSSVVCWLPLFHDMGLIGNVMQPIFRGFSCTLMSPLAFLQRPMRWLEAISRLRATTSGGPNFAYDLCARRATDDDVGRLDLASWTVAYNGAEPVRSETLARFADRFAPCGFRRTAFYPCYGLAEATLLV
jgi:acyl-CoA synthetase (AMP-forming)/AMP-acid ligase II